MFWRNCLAWLLSLSTSLAGGVTAREKLLAVSEVSLSQAEGDHYLQGLAHYKSGRYVFAIDAFQQALRENPGNPWITYYLARSHFESKDRTTAEKLAKALTVEDPTFSRGFFLLGYIYFDVKQWRLAEENLMRAIGLEQDFWESHQVLGLTYVLLDRHEEAERELSKAADLNPNQPDVHYYLGRLYFTRNKFPAALEEFSKMRDLDPSSVKAYNNLGLTRLALNQAEAAVADLKKAIDLGLKTGAPSEWPYVNLGKMYYEQGEKDHSLPLLKRAVEINPRNDVAQYYLGKCLFSLGLIGEAMKAVERAVANYPENAEYYYFLANVYRKSGRPDAARVALKRFEELRKKP